MSQSRSIPAPYGCGVGTGSSWYYDGRLKTAASTEICESCRVEGKRFAEFIKP
jgi:hypothetical protein